MSELVLPVLTYQYLLFPVALVSNGVAVDPTGDTVEVALVLWDATVTDADFVVGDWETADGIYYARTLVGPVDSGATFEVAANSYKCYTKITDSPEVPVLFHGYVRFEA